MADQKTANDLVHGACLIIENTRKMINNPSILNIVRQHDLLVFSEDDAVRFLSALKTHQAQESLRFLRDAIEDVLDS